MFENEQVVRLIQCNRWFATPLGMHVAAAFQTCIQHIPVALSGYRLLQLGFCHHNSWLANLSYPRQFLISPQLDPPISVSCHAALHQLPVASNSMDLVLVPLVHHIYAQYHDFLDEIDRILKSMGYIVFFGINPISFWGLWLTMSKHGCFGRLGGFSHGLWGLKNSMEHREYQLIHAETFYYIPPFQQAWLLQHLGILNHIGRMAAPVPAGFYCLVMQKRTVDFLRPRPYIQGVMPAKVC